MKNLNKHPRLMKQTAVHLKKLISSKIKTMRNKKNEKKNQSKNKETTDKNSLNNKDFVKLSNDNISYVNNQLVDARGNSNNSNSNYFQSNCNAYPNISEVHGNALKFHMKKSNANVKVIDLECRK